MRFSGTKSDRYEFQLNYRHFDYFSSIPSFANPTDARSGNTQSAFDVSRKLFDARLTFRPARAVSPYVAFDYDLTRGPARTNFVQDANEYSVATNVDNSTAAVLGGIALDFSRWSGGFEVGHSAFRDDQSIDVRETEPRQSRDAVPRAAPPTRGVVADIQNFRTGRFQSKPI